MLFKQFYFAIIESVLCTSITVWFSSATKPDLIRLWRLVRSLLSESLVQPSPLSNNCTYPEWEKGAGKITLDPSHTAHSFFELLPSGRRYRALSTRTTRHRNSFFPQAIISWTLDIKLGTHNTVIQLFIHHIHLFFFISNLHVRPVQIIVCIVYCVFAILYIAYLYIVILFPALFQSFCCTAELLSLLQIPCMCKHTWPIKLILILIMFI